MRPGLQLASLTFCDWLVYDKLGLPQSHWIVGSFDRWEIPQFFKGHWQSLHSHNGGQMPAVRAVQRDWERVYLTGGAGMTHCVWVMKWFLTYDLYFLSLCDDWSHVKSLCDAVSLSDEIIPQLFSWRMICQWASSSSGLPVSFPMKWFSSELPHKMVCQWASSWNCFPVSFLMKWFANELPTEMVFQWATSSNNS